MKDLVNNFTFSFSSWTAYRKCPRLWWLKKVAAWEGWRKNAAEDARRAYVLSKMTCLRGLVGRVTHEILEECAVYPAFTENSALEQFRNRMRAAYRESLGGFWRKDPKRFFNLFEHYYYGNTETTKRRARRVFADGESCLRSYFRRIPDLRSLLLRGQVVKMERLSSFTLGTGEDLVTIFVKADLALRAAGTIHLIDWKTGNRRSTDPAQLLIYSLYVLERHGVVLEDIRLHLAYLRNPTSVEDVSVDEKSLTLLRDGIVRAASELRTKLESSQINDAPEDAFPRTEDPAACRFCEMFHRCYGHKDPSEPKVRSTR